MSMYGWSKSFLLGVLFASLRCYSSSSDCSATPLAVVGLQRMVGVLQACGPSYDNGVGGAALSNSPGRLADAQGSLNRLQDTGTPGAVALEGDLASRSGPFFALDPLPPSEKSDDHPAATPSNPAKASGNSAIERVPTNSQPADRNQEIYYRNKTELAFDLGTLPINIPFPFDFMEGDSYVQHPIKYTLIPIILSLRWHVSNIGGPWIFRGNWDLTSSGSFTWIPSGPETRFISYDMGIRRNFVPHNRNFVPYFDIRLGVGQINAKGPKGVPYAQGEDWPEFTMNMGSGVRYNFSPRVAFSAGLNYMHLSNMDLSEHKPNATDPNWGPINYGINVYGPQLGIDMRLGKPHRE